RYRVRFYFDPNGISMAEGDRHLIFIGANLTGVVTQVEFGYSGGSYRLRAAAVNDGTTWTQSEWFAISDGPHAVEIDWRAATGAGANNGGLTLWIDGQQVAVLTGIDNDTRRIELGALGPVFGVNSGTRGSYYFDAFESRRQTYIGLIEGQTMAMPMSQPLLLPTFTNEPTAAPTDQATLAVEPTQLPPETEAPIATDEPAASATPTDVPTDTPLPTNTYVPTDVPTAVPVPTETPTPTAEPAPEIEESSTEDISIEGSSVGENIDPEETEAAD